MNEIKTVADTALWVAAYRARESARPDPLFRDPLAARLAGDRGARIADQMPNPRQSEWYIALRTVIIDRLIETALAEGTDLVVNLGAGLDTRPYRMNLPPDLRWIEVDYPDLLAYKTGILQEERPRCQLERHALDLSQRALRQSFFQGINQRAKKALILTEGVLPYLTEGEVGALAEDLRAMPTFENWIVDYFSPLSMKLMVRGQIKRRLANAPFQFRPENWSQFYASHGWELRQMQYALAVARELGREPPYPSLVNKAFRLLPAGTRKFVDELSGFACLKPKGSRP